MVGKTIPGRTRSATAIIARIGAAMLGNYAASSTASALLAVLLVRGGMVRSDAVVAASIIAILGYLVVLIWAFHSPRLWRLWLVLLAATAACTVIARLLGQVPA